MARQLGQRLVAGFVLCAFAGCSTTATISRTNGPEYEAEILGSNANALRVRDDYGRELRVPREEVADIDHPGNVLYTIGVVLIAVSVPMFIAAAANRSQSGQSDWSGMELAFGIPEAVTGLCLAIPGRRHYRHSKREAKAFEDANPILPVPRPAIFSPYPPPYPYPPPQR